MFNIPHDTWCCLSHTISIEIPWNSNLAPIRALLLKRVGGRTSLVDSETGCRRLQWLGTLK